MPLPGTRCLPVAFILRARGNPDDNWADTFRNKPDSSLVAHLYAGGGSHIGLLAD
jgi:hypothetical protein